MDGIHRFLDVLKKGRLAQGNFLGLLHVLIGRRIETAQGEVVTTGLTWRNLAAELKKVRWDKEAARELGLDPKDLPPRDRERFWYGVIARAGVDTPKAAVAGERMAEVLRAAGYRVGPPPKG